MHSDKLAWHHYCFILSKPLDIITGFLCFNSHIMDEESLRAQAEDYEEEECTSGDQPDAKPDRKARFLLFGR